MTNLLLDIAIHQCVLIFEHHDGEKKMIQIY